MYDNRTDPLVLELILTGGTNNRTKNNNGAVSMTTGQILWGLNSFLFIVCFFFVKVWINTLGVTIGKLELTLNAKLDKITCVERNTAVKSDCAMMFKHKHAPVSGNGLSGGEVIIP